MKQKVPKSTIIPLKLYIELYFNKGLKHIKQIVLPSVSVWIILISILFLICNIVVSEKISPLYIAVTSYDKSSTVSYLRNIRNLSFFEKELATNIFIYGKGLKNDVFSEEIKRKQTIQNFEQLLEKNPDSRDILYGLYLFYSQSDDKIMAEKYLLRAKAIDPSIK